jgi:glutamate formiminotransferase
LTRSGTDRPGELRDETAEWLSAEFAIPTFLYGDQPAMPRTLPEVRRGAFSSVAPDFGPPMPSPQWGAAAVGARPPLLAWNVWSTGADLATAASIARALRDGVVRTRAFPVAGAVQVSCNIVDIHRARVSEILDRVTELLPERASVVRCELVGLAPRVLLEKEDPRRWPQLGLSPGATIESHLGH